MTYTATHGNTGSLTQWVRPGIEPPPSWFLVGSTPTAPRQELLCALLHHAVPLSGSPVALQRWARHIRSELQHPSWITAQTPPRWAVMLLKDILFLRAALLVRDISVSSKDRFSQLCLKAGGVHLAWASLCGQWREQQWWPTNCISRTQTTSTWPWGGGVGGFRNLAWLCIFYILTKGCGPVPGVRTWTEGQWARQDSHSVPFQWQLLHARDSVFHQVPLATGQWYASGDWVVLPHPGMEVPCPSWWDIPLQIPVDKPVLGRDGCSQQQSTRIQDESWDSGCLLWFPHLYGVWSLCSVPTPA